MRIALDGYPLAETKTGVGHYTFELSRHLAASFADDDFSVISPRAFVPEAINDHADTASTDRAQNLRFIHRETNPLTARWWSVGLPLYLRREKPQLFHGTNHQIPLAGSCPTIVTIHDLSLLLYPQTHEPRAVRRGRFFLPRVARRADLIITPTESVRREVVEHLGVSAEKVVAVPEAPRACFSPQPAAASAEVRRRLGVREDFILCVATLEPRKNLVRLLDAFEELLKTTDARPQLVLAGRRGWLDASLAPRIDAAEHTRRLGYVADDDLAALYSSCRLFVYPSLYEGFGLPPLEAMSCGAPVIASRIASVAEVLGDAARLVPPTDTPALTQAIADLWRDADARQHLSTSGLRCAREFTWERTARLTRELYENVVREHARR